MILEARASFCCSHGICFDLLFILTKLQIRQFHFVSLFDCNVIANWYNFSFLAQDCDAIMAWRHTLICQETNLLSPASVISIVPQGCWQIHLSQLVHPLLFPVCCCIASTRPIKYNILWELEWTCEKYIKFDVDCLYEHLMQIVYIKPVNYTFCTYMNLITFKDYRFRGDVQPLSLIELTFTAVDIDLVWMYCCWLS